MRWLTAGCLMLLAAGPAWARHHAAHPAAEDAVPFQAAGLVYPVPATWQTLPLETPLRVGRWRIPPQLPEADALQVVVFFFGPANETASDANIDAWKQTVTKPDGSPVAPEIKTRQVGVLKITQVTLFGTLTQAVPAAGVPPMLRPNYGLIGAMIEGPQGAVYWRVTGPAAAITEIGPAFGKMLDEAKPIPMPKP